MKRSTYFAKKTQCAEGHIHDSKKEAVRCHALHIMQRIGDIQDLEIQPVYEFMIEGRPVKMGNGQRMKMTADFRYKRGGKIVVEDCKAANGHMSRDVPVKMALLRHLYPDISWEIYK